MDQRRTRFEEPLSPGKNMTGKSLDKFDPKSLPANFFYVSVSGVVESGEISNEVYLQCKFELVTGSDWEIVTGQTSGCSQRATTASNSKNNLVWNFPFDVTYRSLNPYGWPQIVVSVIGPDLFGRSIAKGYGSVHVPTTPGYHEREIYLFKPVPISKFSAIFGWLRGKEAEYEDPSRVIAKGEGREVTRVETVGKMKIKFHVSEKNMKKFGYA